MIIDAHAHLSDTGYGNAALYLDQLRESGIQGGIVVPGGTVDVRRMTDYIIGRAQPENLVADNDYIKKACQAGKPILAGLYCIDPHEDNAAAKLAEAFQQGFRGLKLSPLTHQFSFASRAVADLAACCGQWGYPLYSHVLYSPGASTSRFVALARQYPQTPFILGHMGFGPADREGLDAAVKLDNFYLETSTGSYLHIKEATARAGAGKIIFGSEFPLSHPKAELEKILLLKLPAADQDKILGANIAGLLQQTWPPS